jgi:tRNA-2-methylthio-N6-dimethylallyladenosine synthase
VWGDTVADEEKGRRLDTLIAVQEKIAIERNRRLVGTAVEVLVEGPAKRPEGWCMGRTPQFKSAVFPGPARPGDLVTVRVARATAHTLIAEESPALTQTASSRAGFRTPA